MIRLAAVSLVAGLLVAAAYISASDAEATPPAPDSAHPDREVIKRLIRDKPFPDKARNILNSRMQRHAMHMEKLLWATLVLNFEGIESSAEAIAAAPKIQRPTEGPQDALAGLLPTPFFDLQDDLYSNAAALARAGKARDKKAIAESFSELGKTCMSCHSLYLRIDPAK